MTMSPLTPYEPDMQPGNRKGTNPGPHDRTRRTRHTTVVLRTPPPDLNDTAANCGPPFGTKRPQVQILSPRPHLRRSQPCEGFRGSGHAQPEGTKGNIEGTRGNNDQAGWLTTEARDGDKLRGGPGRRSSTARTVLAASGADGRPLKLNVPGPVDGCVLFAPNGGPQLPSEPCRDVPARSARLGTIFPAASYLKPAAGSLLPPGGREGQNGGAHRREDAIYWLNADPRHFGDLERNQTETGEHGQLACKPPVAPLPGAAPIAEPACGHGLRHRRRSPRATRSAVPNDSGARPHRTAGGSADQ